MAATESHGKAAAELEAMRQEAAAAEQRLQAAKVRMERVGSCPPGLPAAPPALLHAAANAAYTATQSSPTPPPLLSLPCVSRLPAGGLPPGGG